MYLLCLLNCSVWFLSIGLLLLPDQNDLRCFLLLLFFFFSSVNTEHKYSAHIEMGKKLFASHVYEIGVTVFAGPMYEIDVIDVARQEDHKMLMRNWTEYYNSPERHKILNVISLEFSKTG